MKINYKNKTVAALIGLLGMAGVNAYAGGGGTGVHYYCGSQKLHLSFQLDNRPDAIHFKKGTQVLVHEPNSKSSFFVVSEFEETSDVVRLSMDAPDHSVPKGIDVEWLSNSIVDHIRISYSHGMHLDTAEDGTCVVLN